MRNKFGRSTISEIRDLFKKGICFDQSRSSGSLIIFELLTVFIFTISCTGHSSRTKENDNINQEGPQVPDERNGQNNKSENDPLKKIQMYQDRYVITDLGKKLVDNRGVGLATLYGVRNFRGVLNGLLYRGGANNLYLKTSPRENRNPLPHEGIQNLCQEGFRKVVYLYPTNFVPQEPFKCELNQNFEKQSETGNRMEYLQISPWAPGNQYKLLKMIHMALMDAKEGPLYFHCWNGWHASGFISALALKQFCNFTNEMAIQYWNQMTDGNYRGEGFDKIRSRITEFVPYKELQIDDHMRETICLKLPPINKQ